MLTNTLDYSKRQAPSVRAELMDASDVTREDYVTAVSQLARANVFTFGYRPTLDFTQEVQRRAAGRPLRIIDIGSGYGDQLRAIGHHLAKTGTEAELIGVDISPYAKSSAEDVAFAANGITLRFETREAMAFTEELQASGQPVDVIFTTLFMHHLENEEIVPFLRFMDENAQVGWFINDLYRSRFASFVFETMTKLARAHPYVSYDGPVSFSRAFREADWQALFSEAGIKDAGLKFYWPLYRLCVSKFRERTL